MTTPTTPTQVRDLLYDDPSQVSEAQLVALIVGKAARLRLGDKRSKVLSSVELGEELYRQAGGGLADFVKAVLEGTIELQSFGIGVALGARLLAAMELAERWRRGFRGGGSTEIRPSPGYGVREIHSLVFERVAGVSEAELLLPLLEEDLERHSDTDALLGFFKTPEDLMESLRLGLFRPARGQDRTYLYLEEADLALHSIPLCRLVAAIELADRYCGDARARRRDLEPGPSGLSRRDLVKLLDPDRRLDRRLRELQAEVLRSHPGLAQQLAELDAVAAEAGVETYEEALEVDGMFEELCERRRWKDPADVLGPQVPFAKLLSVAQARIGRAESPARRLLRVQELLLAAQRAAVGRPVASFVEELLDLAITDEEARTALEEARRRYFEQRRSPSPGEGSAVGGDSVDQKGRQLAPARLAYVV